MDELERLWAERPEIADEGPEPWLLLIDHVLAMCARMRQRLDAYEAFASRVTAIAQEMCDLAEAIRKIAGDSELVLYRYRDLAIGLGALYEEIRGAREWRKKE